MKIAEMSKKKLRTAHSFKEDVLFSAAVFYH